ncbi:MAG: pyrimidine reductase family protein [Acidimicrobiales bacterium]|nr:pyrimidine reductase family protein [Acidimicrobiales bacterium]
MRQLLPEPADVDPATAHARAARAAPAGRPWVVANMITSIDGATAIDGRSEGLGAPADKVVFSALRAVADVILVAAGTARAEGYGPPRTPADRRAERAVRGQAPYPRLALVSRSLAFDVSSPLFTEAPEPPIVFTVAGAPADRRAALEGVAEVVVVGEDDVDLSAALGWLGARGVRIVLTEGGPGLLGQLVAAGLVDEMDLSLAPLLVGGDSPRLAHGAPAHPQRMALAHLWEGDGILFARYVRP